MQKIYTHPCEKCGKDLKVSRTWEEKVQVYGGESVVTHTESVCPDDDCQKLIDEERRLAREKTEKNKRDREERAQAIINAKKGITEDF